MTDDDATRDGLPRFIYGEYTGEIKLPPRPEEDQADGPMDRKTKILVASGGAALVLIIGLVVAALSTSSGPDATPAAANPESSVASVSSSAAPVPVDDAAQPTQSWPQLKNDDIPGGKPATSANPGNPGATKTTKPATQTTKPEGKPTHKPPKPSLPGPR
ncbi:hypothetical protein ACQP2P_36530 [Dactylosporangium sp. CA-139114]|uniref:hypothetical protein n=1 Tax=Dactylosporangium sp. CA-139114 TaxID=3239931 RepID=UPI003D980705